MTRLKLPIPTDSSPAPRSRALVKPGVSAASTTAFQRAMAYMATASSTPDIIAEIAEGASE